MIGRWSWWMIFFQFLATNLPSTDDGDSMRWKLTKNWDFNIRSFYHKLRGSSSIVFPRKVFGRLKHPGVSLSLFGQSHGIGFSRMIICKVRVLILLIGASCVVVVERQWIICCYIVGRLIFLLIKKKKKIVRRLIIYGVLSLALLAFRGLSQDWL